MVWCISHFSTRREWVFAIGLLIAWTFFYLKANQMDLLGDKTYLHELAMAVTTTEFIEHYAQMIQEKISSSLETYARRAS
jgi:hypothetical protein